MAGYLCGWLTMSVLRQNRFGDFVLTREAKLLAGATILILLTYRLIYYNSKLYGTRSQQAKSRK